MLVRAPADANRGRFAADSGAGRSRDVQTAPPTACTSGWPLSRGPALAGLAKHDAAGERRPPTVRLAGVEIGAPMRMGHTLQA